VQTPERTLHTYNACYLVQGQDASLLVETGCAQELPITLSQLDELLARGGPPLRYIFCTHQETPHSAGLGVALQQAAEAVVVGDVRDYHLYFPEIADRLRPMAIGDELDLGGTRLRIYESIVRDLPSTQWGFDTARRVLFPGDGFAYAHYHGEEHCGRTAEEVQGLPIPEMTALFAEAALYWTRFSDMEPYADRLEEFLEHDIGDVRLVAPTHGLPITDLRATMPEVRAGLVGAPAVQ
jgi:flavorubredoxin